MTKPYVPFYKPYGMSDEEYEHEVRIAEQKLAEWEAEQEYLRQMQEELQKDPVTDKQ